MAEWVERYFVELEVGEILVTGPVRSLAGAGVKKLPLWRAHDN